MKTSNGQHVCGHCDKVIYGQMYWIDDQPVCEVCAETLEAHHLNNQEDNA